MLVRFCCRPCTWLLVWQLHERVALWGLVSIWKGTGFVKNSPGYSFSRNGERVAIFSLQDKLALVYHQIHSGADNITAALNTYNQADWGTA